MRIVCPTCESAYDVPAPILSTRRTVRCISCGADWTHAPAANRDEAAMPAEPQLPTRPRLEPPAPEPPPADPPRTEPVAAGLSLEEIQADHALRLSPAPAEAPESGLPKHAIPVIAAWIFSFALLGAIGWSLITWRSTVMQSWPASARLYAALGYLS